MNNMKPDTKNHLEVIVISMLLVSTAIISLLLIENIAPEDFNRMTGRTITRVNILAPPAAACNTTFEPGWNYISLFCISTYKNRDEAIQNMTGLTRMHTYRPNDANDPWKTYTTYLPSWVVNDLSYLSRTEGYLVYLNNTDNISYYLNGSKIIPTNIVLQTGWNLVGYPTDINKPIEEGLSTINDTYVIVYTQNNTDKMYISYSKSSGGTLNETQTYQGYWINMSSGDTWVVNW